LVNAMSRKAVASAMNAMSEWVNDGKQLMALMCTHVTHGTP